MFENDPAFNYWMDKMAIEFMEDYGLPAVSAEGIHKIEALMLGMRKQTHLRAGTFTGEFIIGAVAYYGECLLNEIGGSWLLNTLDIEHQGVQSIKLQNGITCYPWVRIMKLIRNGLDDSLVSLYIGLKYPVTRSEVIWNENGEYIHCTPEGQIRLVNRS